MRQNGGILVAKSGSVPVRCPGCGQTLPKEQLWQGHLCVGCIVRAVGEIGLLVEPWVEGLAPVRQVLLVMIAGASGERGNDITPFRRLQRLLWERDDLAGRADAVGCCYCGAPGPVTWDAPSDLVEVKAAEGLPPIWHCEDVAACERRAFDRLKEAFLAEAARAAVRGQGPHVQ